MEEMLNAFKDYYWIIAAVSGFICWHYRQERKKHEKWKDSYFKKVLTKFHLKSIKNKNINMKKFINSIDFFDKIFIPSYIIHLAKGKAYDTLQKMLVVDYETNYPCKRRVSINSQNKMGDFMDFIFELAMIFFISVLGSFLCLAIALLLLYVFIYLINDTADRLNITSYLVAIFVCIVSILIFALTLKKALKGTDDYTSNTAEINKIIERRKKTYDKISDGLFYIGYQ